MPILFLDFTERKAAARVLIIHITQGIRHGLYGVGMKRNLRLLKRNLRLLEW